MEIIKQHLPDNEYKKVETTKKTIILHHTAGGHRPDWTITAWDNDTRGAVGTQYVLGGKSITNGDTSFDGKLYEALDPKYWIHHLGCETYNNTTLNQQAVAIEICNYGYVKMGKDGNYYNYVNSKVPSSDVFTLANPWKSYKSFHKYTDAQINVTKEWIKEMGTKFGIDYRLGLPALLKDANQFPTNGTVLEKQKWLNKYGVSSNGAVLSEDGDLGPKTQAAIDIMTKFKTEGFQVFFGLNSAALTGKPGLWTHVNFRGDKSDCHPQPQLIEMLISL